jgi:hypothetical protein
VWRKGAHCSNSWKQSPKFDTALVAASIDSAMESMPACDDLAGLNGDRIPPGVSAGSLL